MSILEFETTDFVQVEHIKSLESSEPITFWRNALYVKKQGSHHVVIYTDGTKETLHSKVRMKKYVPHNLRR